MADTNGSTAAPPDGTFRREVADPVFWAALVVGALLAAAGGLAQAFYVLGTTTAQLILCSGLGIIFGAFGSIATIQYKGVVVAGVAAIAIVLLLLVDHLIQDNIVVVEISGDVEGAKIELSGDRKYYGVDNGRSQEFIVVGREIGRDHLYLGISPPAPMDGGSVEEYPFECIAKAEVERYLGSGKTLQWRFDKATGELLGAGSKRIAMLGPCPRGDSPPSSTPASSSTLRWLPALIGAAYAQASVDALLADLESESSVLRRSARSGLAAAGVPMVAPLLARWAEKPDNYRVRLGASVALTELLRADKGSRAAVSGALTGADIRRLVAAAGDPDRTIRIYASEFLYDLGDPRAVPVALEIFPSASDDGKYNLVLVIEGAYPALPEAERQVLKQRLGELAAGVGPKTQQKIADVVGG